MPQRRTKRNIKNNRKTRKGLQTRRSGFSTRNPQKSPWPVQAYTQLRYTDLITMSPGAGLTDTYLFRPNSCYDPDLTSSGHQPMGFDQYATMYNRYRVLGFSYEVRFPPPTVGSCTTSTFATFINGDAYDPAIVFEGSYARRGMTASGAPPSVLRGRLNLRLLNTNPSMYMLDDRYAADVGSNPLEDMRFVLAVNSSQEDNYYVQVSFVYHVQFYDIKTVDPSNVITTKQVKAAHDKAIHDHKAVGIKLF